MLIPLRVLTLAVLLLAPARPADAAGDYQLPVQGSVTDQFRPPATPYGPGNRGWEFATTPGEAVEAAGAGTVTFAGQVGGVLSIVVKHPDGLLTTYSKLTSATVVAGQQVARGQSLGVAGTDTYFGVRSNGAYLDPATLFSGEPYLVDDSINDDSVNTDRAPTAGESVTQTLRTAGTQCPDDQLPRSSVASSLDSGLLACPPPDPGANSPLTPPRPPNR